MIYIPYIQKGKLRDELESCRKEENFGYFVPFKGFYHDSSSDVQYCLLDFFYVR